MNYLPIISALDSIFYHVPSENYNIKRTELYFSQRFLKCNLILKLRGRIATCAGWDAEGPGKEETTSSSAIIVAIVPK